MSCDICSDNGIDESKTFTNTPIEKAALALLKIHQLIEVGYGGNVTDEEWRNITKLKWYFIPCTNDAFKIVCSQNYDKKRNIAFHTQEQAEEFLFIQKIFNFLKIIL